MANFSYVLRTPYKPGVLKEVKQRREDKKSIDSLLNPEQTPVMLIVSFDRKNRFKCKTDLQIFPKHWNFAKQNMRQQVPGGQNFNQRLSELLKNVQDYYTELTKLDEKLSYEQLKELIQEFVTTKVKPRLTENEKSFFEVYDEFIRRKSDELHPRTIQKFKTAKKVLKEFTDKKKKHFSFESIDINFIDAYKHYLQYETKNQKSGKKGFRDDTTAKFIENLKNYLRWSYERGFHSNIMFQHSEFRAKRKKNLDIVTLKIYELKDLYHFDLSDKPTLESVRDIFCFAAFTGQRWSDAISFNKEDLHGDEWIFEAYKTKKVTTIPMVGYTAPALDILKKYDYQLPEISNQKFNDYIKDVAKIVGLNRMVKITRSQGNKKIEIEKPLHEVISSHMARRTAVTVLLNIERMPVSQVMEITGHSDFKTLQRYIDEDKQTLRKNLEQTRSVDEMMKVVKTA